MQESNDKPVSAAPTPCADGTPEKFVLADLECIFWPAVDKNPGELYVKCADHLAAYQKITPLRDRDLIFKAHMIPEGRSLRCFWCLKEGKEQPELFSSDEAQKVTQARRADALMRLVVGEQLGRLKQSVVRLSMVVACLATAVFVLLVERVLASSFAHPWAVTIAVGAVLLLSLKVWLRWLLLGRISKRPIPRPLHPTAAILDTPGY